MEITYEKLQLSVKTIYNSFLLIRFSCWLQFNYKIFDFIAAEQEIYIFLVPEHFFIFIYFLKIDHFDTKFVRDLNFKHKTHRTTILSSSTLVRK